jgi:hypothetical protein
VRLALVISALAAIASVCAQETSNTYTYDVNGDRVAGAEVDVRSVGGATETTERMQSINGRSVPLEKVVERTLRDDGQAKLTERLIIRYDSEGHPGPPEKVRIEESRHSDGSSTIRTTTLRADINGNLRLAERSVANVTPVADGSTTELAIEKPSLNDRFQTVERRTVTAQKKGDGQTEEMVVQRRDQNGQFYEAMRQTRETQQRDGGSVENRAVYELGLEGQMQLAEQTVRRVEKRSDGSDVAEVDIFRKSTPGVAHDADSGPRLIERQTIERRRTESGAVETLSVQRPSLADPSRLGAAVQVAETVCRGKCESK